MPNSLYNVTPGSTQAPLASDLNQIIDALNGNFDIGSIILAAKINAPTGVTAAASSGTTLGVGIYRYKLTYVVGYKKTDNANSIIFGNETDGSATVTATTTSGSQAVTLSNLPITWPITAVGLRIYRTAVGGADGTEKLVATLTQPQAVYIDTISDAALSAPVPTTNTTGTDIANISIVDSASPTGSTGTLKQLIGWLSNRVKTITGKPDWLTTPRTTLENAVKLDGDTMTGDLNVKGLRSITANDWGVISTGGGGVFLVGHNCYIDRDTNQFKYKNTHASLGARGIVLDWSANHVQPMFFDMGSIATTADAAFTPTLYKMWHENNDGTGSGLDADKVQGKNVYHPIGTMSGIHTDAAGMAWTLAWKNYTDHEIFDASNATAPNGSAVNNTNAANPWVAGYPTLQGWNGTSTYGVRVDSARNADYVNGVQFRNNNGNIEYWNGSVWLPVGLDLSQKSFNMYRAVPNRSLAALNAGTYVDLFNLSGTGIATNIDYAGTFSGLGNPGINLLLVIDGVEKALTIDDMGVWKYGNNTNSSSTTSYAYLKELSNMTTKFSSSLALRIRNTNGSGYVNVAFGGAIEVVYYT